MNENGDLKTHNAEQRDNFARRLAAGTIVIILFVITLVGLALYNSRRHYDAMAIVTIQNLTKSFDTHLGDIFDKIDIGLLAVSQETERQLVAGGIKKKELNAYIARQVQQFPEVYGMRVTDVGGNMLYGTNVPAGKPTNISDRDYFKRLRSNPEENLVVSKLLLGRESGKWSILLARRVNHPDGSFGGAAVAQFDVKYFDKLFSQLEIGKGGAIGIRDAELNLIALHPKSQEPASQIGSDVISQKTRDMIRANPVTATYNTVFARDNKERKVTFRKTDRYPFYVFATTAPGDYLTPWYEEAASALMLIAIFALAMIISSRMIYRSRITTLLHAEAKQHAEEMQRRNEELNEALSRVKRLEGIISICSYCKKIQNEQQSWEALEKYFCEHSDAMFSHGICPDCAKTLEDKIKTLKNDKT